MKRGSKFFFRNEKETLRELGLTPTAGSGSGWIQKEDGENDIALVQLKSTDANSYTIKQLDLKTLEYNASVSHKVPVFLIQFLQQNKLYAVINVADIKEVVQALETGQVKERVVIHEVVEQSEREAIRTAQKAREKFHKEKEESYGRGNSNQSKRNIQRPFRKKQF